MRSIYSLLLSLATLALGLCVIFFVIIPFLMQGGLVIPGEGALASLPFQMPGIGKLVGGVLGAAAILVFMAKAGGIVRTMASGVVRPSGDGMGLLPVLGCLFLIGLFGLPYLNEHGLVTLPSTETIAKYALGAVLGLGALLFAAVKLNEVPRVRRVTSGLKEAASTSLSSFVRRIKPAKTPTAPPPTGPAPRKAPPTQPAQPPCELCGARGPLTGLPAPILREPVAVCRGCLPRFPGQGLDWTRLTDRELDAVMSDGRLAKRAADDGFMLGLAHLYEGRGRTGALVGRPCFLEPGPAARLAQAMEVIGSYTAALTLLVRKKSFSKEDFLLFFRLHQKNGTLGEVPSGAVPAALKTDFAEALLEARQLARAREALAELPKKDWGRREFGIALRLAEKTGDLAEAEQVIKALEAALPEKESPEVHYAFALLCERAGLLSKAKRVYRALGGYRDARERLESLDSVSEEEAAAVSDLPALTAAAGASSGQSAFVGAGTIIHKRYRIQRTLGRGGMGFVFLGQDLKRDRPVAVKRVASVLTAQPAFREALVKEATAAWHLEEHAAIAKLHKIVSYGQRLDLVAEFVEGETLSSLLSARGRFPAAECAVFGRMILSALRWAHAKGVLHRDLKPGNIMKTPDGRLKVLDFGVARGHGAGEGGAVGSPEYWAPERHAGKATTASDLYSFGVTLYELLTGAPPFAGEGMLARKRAEQYDALPSGTPTNLRATVAACLRAEPASRLQDAAAVDALLRGEISV